MSGQPHLVVVEGEGVGRVFVLSKPTTTIGRDPAGDVVLPHATVSLHHAAITAHGDRIVASDLGSRNGTFVGVERIVRRQLAAGDLIAIGDRVTLKLAFAGLDERTPAPAGDPGAGAVSVVANAAALVDRLRKERSAARDPDCSLVLMFVGLPVISAPTPSVEELMHPFALACRDALEPGDFLARAAERELIVLLRSTAARALLAGGRIRAAVAERLTARVGALPPAIVVVPIPFHAAVGVEALLLVAARRAAATMRDAPGTIHTVPLHESLH
ncbi:MAG TPA: FHA domain-containing protein [Polyangia bacterium]|jgi:GGDEF domain-containing protein